VMTASKGMKIGDHNYGKRGRMLKRDSPNEKDSKIKNVLMFPG
jgi:hypothetical protein